jgi:hypothetical protein
MSTLGAMSKDIIYEILMAAALIAQAEYKAAMMERMPAYVRYGSHWQLDICACSNFIWLEGPFRGINRVNRSWYSCFRAFVNLWPSAARLAAEWNNRPTIRQGSIRVKQAYAPIAVAAHASGRVGPSGVLVYTDDEDIISRIIVIPGRSMYIWLCGRDCNRLVFAVSLTIYINFGKSRLTIRKDRRKTGRVRVVMDKQRRLCSLQPDNYRIDDGATTTGAVTECLEKAFGFDCNYIQLQSAAPAFIAKYADSTWAQDSLWPEQEYIT